MAEQALLWDTKFFWKKCLTIDIRQVNNLEPSKYRIGAENVNEQTCYFYYNKKDRAFNRFLVVRKETSANEIAFSILNLIDKSNRFKDINYKLRDQLREFDKGRFQPKSTVRKLSEADIRQPTGDTDRGKKTAWQTWMNQQKAEISFKIITLSKTTSVKPYTTTRIKSIIFYQIFHMCASPKKISQQKFCTWCLRFGY